MGLIMDSQKRNTLIIMFYLVIIVFVITVGMFLIPGFRGYINTAFVIISGIILVILGSVLIGLTLVQKVEGKLKKFLILTGASAAGFFVFALLHNIFYALEQVTSHITILSYLMKAFEVIFFLIAIFACPIGFLIGVIGSIVLFIKKRKSEQENSIDKL
jgi:putative Mn2+ efflux pump MntP